MGLNTTSYWQEHCSKEQFRKWCGNHKIEWKVKLRQHIKEQSYKSVLDVGAGLFSEYYGFKEDKIDIQYTATEITDKFIEEGLENGINVSKASATLLPFKDNSFDVVLLYDVINHLVDYESCIEELIRVAKKEVIIAFHKDFTEDKRVQEKIQNLYDDGVIVMKHPDQKSTIIQLEGHVDIYLSKNSLLLFLEKLKQTNEQITFKDSSCKVIHDIVNMSIAEYDKIAENRVYIIESKKERDEYISWNNERVKEDGWGWLLKPITKQLSEELIIVAEGFSTKHLLHITKNQELKNG